MSVDAEFVDGRVRGISNWAIMCLGCHAERGAGLGTGLGQRYTRVGNHPDGDYEKTGG